MSRWDRHLVPSTDPVLKAVCRPIELGEGIAKLCEIMENVCKRGTRKGVGLAAPQVGHAIRLIFTNCRDENGCVRGRFMLNPKIVERAKTSNVEPEGCLSYPGKEKRIARPDWIFVEYESPERFKRALRATGYQARVICHECDHLDGICRVGDDSPEAVDVESLVFAG